jgi:8-oxo-dGTP pyrophosphatase MutT (NUDIX family)
MSRSPIDPEMKRRFERAERTRISDTPLRRPRLAATSADLRAYFESPRGRAQIPLENPHLEPGPTEAECRAATPAAILLAIVMRKAGPTVIVTQRHADISYPGHWVFPGGRSDPTDATPIATALREAEEEIGLHQAHVNVLGRLGDYVSHSGFRIAPVVAIVEPPFDLRPSPNEVEAIAEIELARLLDPASYFLYRFSDRSDRAHFALDIEAEEITLTGVTASICIGLYSELLEMRS